MNWNEDTLKGKWKEIKGEVQKAWGKLTDDELTQTKGDVKAISGLVQQRYGESKENFEKKFSDIVDRFNTSRDQKAEQVKRELRDQN